MNKKEVVRKTVRFKSQGAGRFANSVARAWAHRIARIWNPRAKKKAGPVSKKLKMRIDALPIYTRASFLDLNDFVDPDRAHVVIGITRQAIADWCGRSDPTTITSNMLLNTLRPNLDTLNLTVTRALAKHADEIFFSSSSFTKAVTKTPPKTVEDMYRCALQACGLVL